MKTNYFYLILFKLIYTFFAVFIFANLTSLGDSNLYLNGDFELNFSILTSSTSFVIFITYLLKKVLYFPILVHLFYCIITFLALKYLLRNLKLNNTLERLLIFLLIMPSFGMWTSIISKEAANLFFTCYVLIWVINLFNKKKTKFIFLYVFSLYFSIILRPTVGVSLFILIIYLYINNSLFTKNLKITLLTITSLIFILFLYLLLPYINEIYLPMAQSYFDPKNFDARSTRDINLWNGTYEFFTNAPYGILIANIGPTLNEAFKQPLFLPYFIEGFIFISTILYFISNFFINGVINRNINFHNTYFILFFLFLLLLINYPFQIFNPGSAIRYRSSYYHIILALLLFLYNKRLNNKINENISNWG